VKRLLLDTHAFLWWIGDSPQLSNRARAAIGDQRNECFFSLASCWEIAIKVGTGKLELPAPVGRFLPEQLAANQIRELPIEVRHVAGVSTLPFHHRDPFDRLLVVQALEEALAIVSADSVFRRYGVKRVW
jgi:PIN domain nuclease of toxin-antitoxin system